MLKVNKSKHLILRLIMMLTLALLTFSFSSKNIQAEAVNLIENEGFEEELDNTWEEVSWDITDGSTLLIQDFSEFNSGKSSVRLTNISENDFRVRQEVEVEPDQLYRLSAFIKTDNIPSGSYGGAISVWETFVGTGSVVTNGEWQYSEFYGKTGKDQDELLVTFGLGGYGNVTTGDVWFDDVSVEVVESVPSGAIVQDLGKVEEANTASVKEDENDKKQYIYFYTILYLLLLLVIYTKYFKNGVNSEVFENTTYLVWILGIITLIKVIIAPFTQGFDNDIALFSNWGLRAADDFMGLYESEGFLDYPPLYMYVLAVIGKLNQWFNIEFGSYFYELLLKLPSIIADGLTSFLLFKMSEKLNIKKIGFLAAIIYILNPLVILDATIWGQVDSLFVLIILTGLYFMWHDRMVFSSVSFAMAVLLKPQGIIFLPILFFELVRRKDVKLFLECVWKSVIAGIVVILPFVFKSGPLFIIRLYVGTVGGYTYATFNAFNFFGLLGANYTPDNETLFILSYGMWGLIGIIIVTSFVMWLFYKNYTKLTPILGSLILCSGVFIFSARMHERYMFPALALILATYILNANKKYLIIFVGLTISNLINVQLVLYHHYFIEELFINPDSLIIKIVALMNIVLFAWLIKITLTDQVRLHNLEANKELPKIRVKQKVKPAKNYNVSYSDKMKNNKLTRKDVVLMTIMTVGFLMLTLYQLGNTSSPESRWSIPTVGESFVVEFDVDVELGHISYFTGVANGYDNSGTLSIEVANIDNEFVEVGSLEENGTFIWKVSPMNVKTGRLRFTSVKEGGMIHEMGFYDIYGEQIAGFLVPERSSGIGEINYLFDEQDLMEIYPDHMNSTYFDEVYFARTAYEIDEDYYIYESTHPTLGKLLILVGIKIFGNNPFGWRIMGALMGVLLIPIMYVFGKKLFKNSLLAFASAFLMMFDFMHFTHTRFASIDVFTVVCVLLMYYFMYRYYVMNTYKAKRMDSLKFLMLSGLFMALGISTKWNVVYGVVGLAITFFASRYFIYYYYNEKGMFVTRPANSKHPFIKKEIIETFMLCIPVFVVIPLIIYGVLHIPVITGNGESGIKQIINYQIDMYNYHSNNAATHPFSSKWFEWPIMIKPLWLYSYGYAANGLRSTIASFGNPAIWWTGIVAFFVAGAIVIKEKDRRFAVIFVAYLMQILPWVFVERTTYIYHYFTAVPFNIFMIVYVFAYLIKKRSGYKYALYVYLVIVAVLFVVFYPVLSGSPATATYIEKLLLMDSWYF